jgi:hypothetical protein
VTPDAVNRDREMMFRQAVRYSFERRSICQPTTLALSVFIAPSVHVEFDIILQPVPHISTVIISYKYTYIFHGTVNSALSEDYTACVCMTVFKCFSKFFKFFKSFVNEIHCRSGNKWTSDILMKD